MHGGDRNRVSVNKAFAFNVNGDRVGLYRVNGGVQAFINGRRTSINGTRLLGRGGAVRKLDTNVFSIKWPDGTWAKVSAFGERQGGYLDLKFLISGIHAERTIGLLGNFDGDSSNDIKIRRGEVLGTSVEFETLYGDFANSWRVTQSNTLFDYRAGESTTTFTNRNFPRNTASTTDLNVSQRSSAEQICRAAGISDPILLEACIVDVAFTQDSGFADSIAEADPPDQGTDVFQSWRLYGNANRFGGNIHLARDSGDLGGAYKADAKLDLTEDFDLRFRLYLGADERKAGGVIMVFRDEMPPPEYLTDPTAGSCRNCIGIAIYTRKYIDEIDGDSIFFFVVRDGELSVDRSLPIVEIDNVEDGREHSFRVRWRAATQRIIVELDGESKLNAALDLSGAVGGANEVVYGLRSSVENTGDAVLHYFRPGSSPLGITGPSGRVSNGGFEQVCQSGSDVRTIGEGESCVSDWDVVGEINLVRETERTTGGEYGVSLSGRTAGVISQYVETEPGKKYHLNFDLISNTRRSYENGFIRVETDNGELKNFNFRSSRMRRSTSDYSRQYWSFTATQPITKISFAGQHSNSGAGPLIDNIHVFEAPDSRRASFRTDCEGGGSSSGGNGSGGSNGGSSGGDSGDPPPGGCRGDSQLNPISPESGCKFQLEADYVGDSGLTFVRKYDSSGFYYRGNGDEPEENGYHHWRHSHQYQLFKLKQKRHSVLRPSGHIWYFDANGKQENAHGGALGKIKKTSTGWTLTRVDGTKEFYNSRGQIKKILEPNGDFLSYTYSTTRGNRLIQVRDRYGKSLRLGYNRKGQLSIMTDPSGRNTRYGYDKKGNLVHAVYPNGSNKQYSLQRQKTRLCIDSNN